jgi:NADPH2:quinone reductase
VRAVSVNPVDYKKRQTKNFFSGIGVQDIDPAIYGWEASGVVVATGSDVKKFNVGDEVYFGGNVLRPGANAEFTLVDERIAAKKPKSFTHEQAAALPLTLITAWEAFEELMRAEIQDEKNPKTMLIIGGAGGVGSIAIQLAKKVWKFRTIATASRPESVEYCKKMGADHVIDHRDLRGQLDKLGVKTVDFLFDCYSSGDIIEQLPSLMSTAGHVTFVLPVNNLVPFFARRIGISFEWMFGRPQFDEEQEKHGEILQKVADLIDQGVITDRVTKIYPNLFEDLPKAHQDIETGHTLGKVVLRVPKKH